jgi:hypothetical protein
MPLSNLAAHPSEWHQRGLRHPAEIEALVFERINGNIPPEPSYGDFFRSM